MSTNVTTEETQKTPDTASMEDAYLAIPDEQNPAIIDARKTYVVTAIMAVLFIGAVLLFIL